MAYTPFKMKGPSLYASPAKTHLPGDPLAGHGEGDEGTGKKEKKLGKGPSGPFNYKSPLESTSCPASGCPADGANNDDNNNKTSSSSNKSNKSNKSSNNKEKTSNGDDEKKNGEEKDKKDEKSKEEKNLEARQASLSSAVGHLSA